MSGRAVVAESRSLFGLPGSHPSRLVHDKPAHVTTLGATYVGDSTALLAGMAPESLDLVVTSSPYALRFQKEYLALVKSSGLHGVAGHLEPGLV
jgi:hypothetical protein